MKQLTLIVHEDIEQALSDILRGLPQVTGFTFSHVEGHGQQNERDPMLSARDRVVGYVPHVRVDILLKGEDVDAVLEALRQSMSGVAGRARYWVTEVEREGRL
jgi:nitrogen regulatory protein P-II 1